MLLAQENKSIEFRIVVSVQPLCAEGLPKPCSQAADQPPPAARLPAASATCACMQRAACSACCLTSRISPLSFRSNSHRGRSCCMAEEFHRHRARAIYRDFQTCYPDLGSCLSSFNIPGSQPEKKSLACATGRSCSQRSLCYTPVCGTVPLKGHFPAKSPACLALKMPGW